MIMYLVVRRTKLLNLEGGVEFLNVSWCCRHSCWLLLFCVVGTVHSVSFHSFVLCHWWSHSFTTTGTYPIQGVRGRLHEKLAPARVSYWDDFLISYRIYMMTGSFHISLFEGTFHVDKIHVWFKIANIMHPLHIPVYWQTDFTPKRVIVSHLHDTIERFHTGVKFSPWYNNQGELTPGWCTPAWHFVVVSCKQI